MKRIGVYIDISNIYYCLGKKFPKRKLSYRSYMDFIKDIGNVTLAHGYGAAIGSTADAFIRSLNEIGIETHYKPPKEYAREDGSIRRKSDWDVAIAINIIDNIDKFDMLILGTADGDFVPLAEWVRARGKEVVIFACDISRDLKDVADSYIEIPESILENRNAQVSR